jgi:predicted kinase
MTNMDNNHSDEPSVHLMCGLPAAGKTTYAVALAESRSAVRFTLDEMMLALFQLSHDDPAYVEAIPRCKSVIHKVAEQVLQVGHDVVFDWNHWGSARRAETAKWAADHGAKPVVHFVDVPVETAVQRALRRAKSAIPTAHVLDEEGVRHALSYFEGPSEVEGLAVVRSCADW